MTFGFSILLSWADLTLQRSKVGLKRHIYALPWGMYGRFVVEVSNLPLRAKRRNQKSLFVAHATKSDIFIFSV